MKQKSGFKNIFIDGHVHFYDNFNPNKFFLDAEANFLKYSKSRDKEEHSHFVLMFSEGRGYNYYRDFISGTSKYFKEKLLFNKTEEPWSHRLEMNGREMMTVINGRQIITKEKLEILHLGTDEIIDDGIPASTVLKKIFKSGGIAVIAWGVGKWFFSRGKIVKTLIEEFGSESLFLGDNSARPLIWAAPKLYKTAKSRGIKILAGSDPLPIEKDDEKPGSYIFSISGNYDPNKPFNSIRKILMERNSKTVFWGSRDSILNFFRRQIIINMKKYS